MSIDKDWRPADWNLIKQNVLNETPVIFSPSAGYSKDQKDTIMEKVASALITSILVELAITETVEVTEDARSVHNRESESQEDRPSDELAWSGWGPSPTSQPQSESEPD